MQGIELCAWVIPEKYVVMDELWPAGHSGKAPDIGRQAARRDGLGRQQVAGRRAKGAAAQCLRIAVEHHVPGGDPVSGVGDYRGNPPTLHFDARRAGAQVDLTALPLHEIGKRMGQTVHPAFYAPNAARL